MKRVEKKKNRKRAKNRPKPGKSFEREDLENAFEITIKAHRIRFVNLNNILLDGKQGLFLTFFNSMMWEYRSTGIARSVQTDFSVRGSLP